jgi:hypothetical protein
VSKITISPDQARPTNVEEVQNALATSVLQEVKVNTNIRSSTLPSLEAIKPFSPLFLDVEPKRENELQQPVLEFHQMREVLLDGQNVAQEESRLRIKKKMLWDRVL